VQLGEDDAVGVTVADESEVAGDVGICCQTPCDVNTAMNTVLIVSVVSSPFLSCATFLQRLY
jgi:hypothetical protein